MTAGGAKRSGVRQGAPSRGDALGRQTREFRQRCDPPRRPGCSADGSRVARRDGFRGGRRSRAPIRRQDRQRPIQAACVAETFPIVKKASSQTQNAFMRHKGCIATHRPPCGYIVDKTPAGPDCRKILWRYQSVKRRHRRLCRRAVRGPRRPSIRSRGSSCRRGGNAAPALRGWARIRPPLSGAGPSRRRRPGGSDDRSIPGRGTLGGPRYRDIRLDPPRPAPRRRRP